MKTILDKYDWVTYENEDDIIHTFKSWSGYYCIMLNAVTIYSTKQFGRFKKELDKQIAERVLTLKR